MRITHVLLLIAFYYASAQAKRFDTRCKLVRELIKVGMPNDLFLGQWVCLIEKVSNRDTRAFVITPSGKKNYGLYQIPSRWCRPGKKGGECNVACESPCILQSEHWKEQIALRLQATSSVKFPRDADEVAALLDDNIQDDTACAVNIFHKEGFKYWSQWTARCKNDNTITNEIYKCPDLNSPRTTPEREIYIEKLRKRRRLVRSRVEQMRQGYAVNG